MFKKIALATAGIVASLALTGHVFAAKQVTIQIEQPKSPTNQTNFTISFVTLDLQGRDVTVKCFKQGPSDGGYTQFGGDQNLSGGGNGGNCNVDGSIVNSQGTYSFKVEATAGDGAGDNFDSDTTSVTFDTSGPGDVRDYSKNKTNSCEYTIHFRTADDAGQTVKVELYRSDAVPFDANSGTRIQSLAVGSNEAKDTTDTPPDCNKTYYYAVRAFDSAGNGSSLVGDNVTNVTVISPTPGGTAGAIPLSSGQGSILGAGTGAEGTAGTTGAEGETLGETSPSAEVVDLAGEGAMPGWLQNLLWGAGILGAGVLLYAIIRRVKSQNTPQA
jgi:hypothetical protein